MKIISAGPKWSGDVWLFNCIRTICNLAGTVCSGGLGKLETNPNTDYTVLKGQGKDEVNPGYLIFTSRRDLRDVVASALKYGHTNVDNALNFADRIYEEDVYWVKQSSFIARFEDMIRKRTVVIENIVRVLGVRADANEVSEILGRISVPKDNIDPITLVPPGHQVDYNIGHYKNILPRDVIVELEDRFREWIQRYHA
jgi:hypothetical protein